MSWSVLRCLTGGLHARASRFWFDLSLGFNEPNNADNLSHVIQHLATIRDISGGNRPIHQRDAPLTLMAV